MTSLNQRHIKPSLDDLPKRFVVAMKTLFDIMDDQKTGQINFKDIETRWSTRNRDGNNSVLVPNGVIEALQKVTPPNGLLTFERFCAGLKICLLRHRVSHHHHHHRQPSHGIVQRHRVGNNNGQPTPQPVGQVSEPRGRPSSVPLPDRGERSNGHGSNLTVPKPSAKPYGGSDRSLDRLAASGGLRPLNTATVRPNNVVTAQQRSVSVPHLQAGAEPSRLALDPRRGPGAREIPSKLRGYRSDNRLHHGATNAVPGSGILRFSRVRSKTPDPTVELSKGTTSQAVSQKKTSETQAHKENRNPQQPKPLDEKSKLLLSVSLTPDN